MIVSLPDPKDILDTLGVEKVSQLEPVSGGSDTLIWKVVHGGEISALRLFRPEQADAAQREAMAMTAARSVASVPRIRRDGFWHERPVLLLEWMRGVPLRDRLLSNPERTYELGVAFGRTQALIHSVEAPKELQTGGWTDWIGIPFPNEARGNALLHFDYHPLNVLFDGETVSGVVDWPNCGAGDPRLDAARTLVILQFAPAKADGVDPALIDQAREALITSWRSGYLANGGSLSGFAPFLAWAGKATLRDLERKNDPDIAETIATLCAYVEASSFEQ
jgi:aminoglycoside phosphotransferase (APT) family kinase protein